jgi:hypothetical protein
LVGGTEQNFPSIENTKSIENNLILEIIEEIDEKKNLGDQSFCRQNAGDV